MVIRLPRYTYKAYGDSFHLLFMSDLHIGAAECDKQLIRSELEWAKANDARVLIAGDVFDLILPKDHRRFDPSVLDPVLHGKTSVVNAALSLAVDILGPFASQLHMIGTGNHESMMGKHHSLDPIALLIERLQERARPKHTIHHGAYTGAVVLPYANSGGGDGGAFRIWYHHGVGAGAPVTRGMIDFARASAYVENANALWMGHKHHRYAVSTEARVVPQHGSKMIERHVWHLMTGAYTGAGEGSQLDSGGCYQQQWAVEKGFAPQGKGGIKMEVTIRRQKGAGMEPQSRVILEA